MIWRRFMRNMKIPVENNLNEIVVGLERLGRKYLIVAKIFEGKGTVIISQLNALNETYSSPIVLTTLAELKDM